MKPTFLNQSRPLITSMINRDADPVAVRYAIKNSICDGADAIGIQLCKLKFEYRTEEHLKTMFAAAGQRPIYITNYRMAKNENLTYEECMNGLLMGLRYGATLADIMGDTFDKSEMELTKDPSAIDRQRKLIDQIHAMGKEVLMSSHILKFTPAEVVLEVALEHQRRGADISKIVTFASSEEEEMENLRITTLLKKELDIPFLFLSGGTHSKIHRRIGPMLNRIIDNSKILNITGMKQSELMPLKQGLAHEFLRLPKDYVWRKSDINQRMDEYLKTKRSL